MAKTDEDIKKLIQASQCYGLAFDSNESECQGCDVRLGCAQHMAQRKKQLTEQENEVSNVTTPSKPTNVPTKKSNKKSTNTKTYKQDMPAFVHMDMNELEQAVIEHGGNIHTFDKYTSPPIKRMRIVMWLKSQYEV